MAQSNAHKLLIGLGILVLAATSLAAQQASVEGEEGGSFDTAATDMHQRLEQSLAELAALREQIAAEKIPLGRQLADLEAELSTARQEYQQTTRLLDTGVLELANLRTEIEQRREESTYLSNLLGEYVRKFETRLHIAELQRYEDAVEAARLAPENATLSDQQVFEAQAAIVTTSLDRLFDALGGATFDGTAVDSSGLVRSGSFLIVGPAAFFASSDKTVVGTVEQRLGSLEPTVVPFEQPAEAQAAQQLLAGTGSIMPLDPTLGNAHVIESTKDTVWEHIQKGGPVMVPIFLLAGAAFLVALYKAVCFLFVRTPSRRGVQTLVAAVARRDRDGALKAARAVRGPAGPMLTAGVEHLDEPRELIEEVMYERVLSTRLRLNRFLPFIAISAAAAPLLGLLGTVTGIINTFKLITVFGTGDVKTLSGGISEALITTEFGLIVAIPSLLLHALLSRQAKAVIDQMDKAAVAFVNQVSKTPLHRPVQGVSPSVDASVPLQQSPTTDARGGGQDSSDAGAMAQQMKDILADLLTPMVQQSLDRRVSRDKAATASTEDIDAGRAVTAGRSTGE